MNKYGAKRTYSILCERMFASKLECKRGEELHIVQLGGEISDLKYQVKFVLSEQPRVTITLDFTYIENGVRIYEDAKGVLTRDFRTKLIWLKKEFDVDVKLSS